MRYTFREKLPYKFMSFSLCQVCGQTWPSSKITYNPRWGWQCPPCWDGLISRDQIMRPIFPYEGTRKVTSPVVPAGEGLSETADTPYYIYTLYDRADRSTTYDITFGSGADGLITFYSPSIKVGTDGVTPNGGICLNNGYVLYIKNEYLQYSGRFMGQKFFTKSTWSGAGDLHVDDESYLTYTPYEPSEIQGLD